MIAAALVGDTQDTSVNILSLNLTFLIQAAAFLLLLAILAKWVFPPIVAAADSRQRQIDGALGEAERGRQQIAGNQKQIEQSLEEARETARTLIGDAQKAAAVTAEATRNAGRERAQAEIDKARTEIDAERSVAAGALRTQVVALVTAAATRLGGAAVDENAVVRAVSEVLG